MIAVNQAAQIHNIHCFVLKPYLEKGFMTMHIHLSRAISKVDMFDARREIMNIVPANTHKYVCFQNVAIKSVSPS